MVHPCFGLDRLFPKPSRKAAMETGRKEVPGGWEGPGVWAQRSSLHRSIHNGVIAVFQRKGLPDQELFTLNEGVR